MAIAFPRLHLRARLVAFAVVLLCLAAGCTKEAKRERSIKRANSYFEARQYQKAVIEYLNALRLEPENSHCISRLAITYYEQGQILRALPFLLKAQKLDSKGVEIRTRLAHIYSEAQAVAKARALALEILELEPANEEAWLLVSGTSVTPEEIAEVERRIAQARSQLGDRSALHLAAGMVSLRQKEFDKAELAFKKAFSLNPKSPSACRTLASVYFLRGKIDEARQQHELEIKLAPQNFFARLRLAEFHLMTGALKEAKAGLEALAKDAPDFVPARGYLATLALEEKNYDACASLVKRILAQSPEDFRALSLRARLSMARGDVGHAIEEFKRLRSFYTRVPSVHYQLARAYLATNDIENALTSLEGAISLNPNFTDALFLKGGINLRKGDYASAIDIFSQLIRQNPQMAAAQFYLADAYRGRGSLEEALTIYRRLSTSHPTNAEIPYLMGRVYRQQKKSRDAEMTFLKALELNPGHAAAFNQLVEMKILEKDYSSALKLVDGVISRAPKSSEAWFLRAKVAAAQGEAGATETALLKTIELDTNSMPAYVALAKVYLDSNRGDQAIHKLDEVLARTPGHLPALIQKATIHEKMSNYVKAAESYEQILTIAPRFGLVLNNLAYLYFERLDKLDRAQEMATKARELLPESPEIADTLGWITYQRKDYNRAVGLLSEAAAKLPGSAEVQFHLGMAQYRLGAAKEAKELLQRALELSKDFQGADEARQRLAMLQGDSGTSDSLVALQKLLEKEPNDPIGLMRLADLQARSGAWDKARGTYEQLLKLTPQSVPTIMKLARLCAEKLNDFTKALELAKQGRSLAPNDPQVGLLCGRLAFQGGDHPWAVDVLQQTVPKQPPQPDLLYDFAWALYSVGRISEAHNYMRQVIQLDPSFTNAAQARQFLFLTDLATNVTGFPEAAAAVESQLKSNPDFVPALVVLAALQTQQGASSNARQTYEKILARYPHFTPALRAVVTLPEGSGNDRRDFELASNARKAFPNDDQVAKALGRALYKRGDYTSARGLLQQATKSLPDDAEAHYYLGMSSYKLGNQQQGRLNLQRASELGLKGDQALEAKRILGETK